MFITGRTSLRSTSSTRAGTRGLPTARTWSVSTEARARPSRRRPGPTPELLRPLDEYAAVAGGAFLMAGVDHDTLAGWLTRLQLTAIRDQLDNLLDEAAERKLTLRESLAMLVEREVSRKDERRIEMAFKLAHFPTVRELAAFDFKAQPKRRQAPGSGAGDVAVGGARRRAFGARSTRGREVASRDLAADHDVVEAIGVQVRDDEHVLHRLEPCLRGDAREALAAGKLAGVGIRLA